jgi:hypothetical protein
VSANGSYQLEHFYWGKFDDSRYGGRFRAIGETDNLMGQDVYLHQVASQVNIIIPQKAYETFRGAFAWRWLGDFAIIARFERSPSVESSERPYYFLQAHYLIVPSKLIYDLDAHVFPLMELLARKIERYKSMQKLHAISASVADLSKRLPRKITGNAIPFIQSVFSDEPVVFEDPDANPQERLEFLHNLVSLFPSKYRARFTFSTSYDTSLGASQIPYRLLFSEERRGLLGRVTEIAAGSGKLSMAKPPKLLDKKSGANYTRWIDSRKALPLNTEFFSDIRYPQYKAEGDIELQDLERAASFIRRRGGIVNRIEARTLIEVIDTVPSFLYSSRDLLTTEERETILNGLADLTYTDEQVGQLLKTDQGAGEHLLIQLREHLWRGSKLALFALRLLKWILEEKLKFNNSLAVVSALLENKSFEVLQLPWWNTYTLEDLGRNLTVGAMQSLKRSRPNTSGIIEVFVSDSRSYVSIARMFSETDSKGLLFLVLTKAMSDQKFFLLDYESFKELLELVARVLPPDWVESLADHLHEFLSASHYLENIAQQGGDVFQYLKLFRDFVVNLVHNSSNEDEKRDLYGVFFGVFRLFSRFTITSAPLPQRDTKMLQWGQVLAQLPSTHIDFNGYQQDNFEDQLTLSTIILSITDYSNTALSAKLGTFIALRQFEQHHILIWVGVFRSFNTLPKNQKPDRETIYSIMEQLLVSIVRAFPNYPELMINYLYQLTSHAQTNKSLREIWRRWLEKLPERLPSHASHDLESLQNMLQNAESLQEDASVLQNALAALYQHISDSREISSLFLRLHEDIAKLVTYAERYERMSNKEDRDYYIQQIGRILSEDGNLDQAQSQADQIIEHLKAPKNIERAIAFLSAIHPVRK